MSRAISEISRLISKLKIDELIFQNRGGNDFENGCDMILIYNDFQ